VRKLLVVNPAKRLTCEQVLAHPWMTLPGVERELARTRSHFSESSVHGR
jgi:calcium/calmodulin-dependent protein kinase I